MGKRPKNELDLIMLGLLWAKIAGFAGFQRGRSRPSQKRSYWHRCGYNDYANEVSEQLPLSNLYDARGCIP